MTICLGVTGSDVVARSIVIQCRSLLSSWKRSNKLDCFSVIFQRQGESERKKPIYSLGTQPSASPVSHFLYFQDGCPSCSVKPPRNWLTNRLNGPRPTVWVTLGYHHPAITLGYQLSLRSDLSQFVMRAKFPAVISPHAERANLFTLLGSETIMRNHGKRNFFSSSPLLIIVVK